MSDPYVNGPLFQRGGLSEGRREREGALHAPHWGSARPRPPVTPLRCCIRKGDGLQSRAWQGACACAATRSRSAPVRLAHRSGINPPSRRDPRPWVAHILQIFPLSGEMCDRQAAPGWLRASCLTLDGSVDSVRRAGAGAVEASVLGGQFPTTLAAAAPLPTGPKALGCCAATAPVHLCHAPAVTTLLPAICSTLFSACENTLLCALVVCASVRAAGNVTCATATWCVCVHVVV